LHARVGRKAQLGLGKSTLSRGRKLEHPRHFGSKDSAAEIFAPVQYNLANLTRTVYASRLRVERSPGRNVSRQSHETILLRSTVAAAVRNLP